MSLRESRDSSSAPPAGHLTAAGPVPRAIFLQLLQDTKSPAPKSIPVHPDGEHSKQPGRQVTADTLTFEGDGGQ